MVRYRREIVLSVVLAVVTFAVFSRVLVNKFVNYDDREYVTENSKVQSGLNATSVSWAWTKLQSGNWHPLTWLSLELDAQLYGLNPTGFHLTNLVLHVASTVLLFWVLRAMTGAIWQSAFVAALFAIHPLNVEPVAWVAERKGVLSTLFWMLTLAAYVWYARRPGIGRYALVVLALVLGFLAKPMLLTLPFVLLLLDYWPLRRPRLGVAGSIAEPGGSKGENKPPRFQPAPISRLVYEKIPLFVLVAVFVVVAAHAQGSGGALKSLDEFPLGGRLNNAIVSYVRYLGKAIWPSGLVPVYPPVGYSLPAWKVDIALALLVLLSAALLGATGKPYLVVGWLWYLGTLVPVIGLVQIGIQGAADRYTYVPLIGVFVLVVWGIADLARRYRLQTAAATLGGGVIVAFMACSWVQAGYWHDSVRLWSHTVSEAETGDAHVALGLAYQEEQKNIQRATHEYLTALRLNPATKLAHLNQGRVLESQGKLSEAEEEYRAELQVDPRSALALVNLGAVMEREGRLPEAAQEFEKAIEIKPTFGLAHRNLGVVFREQGRLDDAAREFTAAIELNSHDLPARLNLGLTLQRLGRIQEALQQYQTALALGPTDGDALATLADGFESVNEFRQAEACWRRVVELQPTAMHLRLGLAAFLHRRGQTAAEAAVYQEAFQFNPRWPEAADRIAWSIATRPGVPPETVRATIETAQQVCRATANREPKYLDTLAAAYAAAGQYGAAVATAQEAMRTASSAQQTEVARQIEQRLLLYQRQQPFRESPGQYH